MFGWKEGGKRQIGTPMMDLIKSGMSHLGIQYEKGRYRYADVVGLDEDMQLQQLLDDMNADQSGVVADDMSVCKCVMFHDDPHCLPCEQKWENWLVAYGRYDSVTSQDAVLIPPPALRLRSGYGG